MSYFYGLAGSVQWAGPESTFGFGRTPKAGCQGWSNYRAKGRGKCWVEGTAKTISEKVDGIWDKDENNGGNVAKTNGIFASKSSAHISPQFLTC